MGFIVSLGVTLAVPLESTTVKILVPPPSSVGDSDDDAVVSK
jgi:hypothetical protein